jgi:MoxR-like ATPase
MSLLKDRIVKLITLLNEGIYERNEMIAVSLLAALAEQNIFLLGPPGTAKSLISRRLACAFETKKYFECLMHRFSTPEEVFGPISIKELKEDRYTRKVEGFLPKAEFAFLDEIWKSSPAVLNALLTIINEKIFHNGTKRENVPLKALISASNETPADNEGLSALYDRFLVRLHVSPMQDPACFEMLLQAPAVAEHINNIPPKQAITTKEWKSWQTQIDKVQLSGQTLDVIQNIKRVLAQASGQNAIYVSDRRWQRAAKLLKAAAFFCDRQETSLVDTLLLRHCLWSSNDNREVVIKIVEDAVENCKVIGCYDLKTLQTGQKALEDKIRTQLYWPDDCYQTVTLVDNKQYFKYDLKRKTLGSKGEHVCPVYIPLEKMNSHKQFTLVTKNLLVIKGMNCRFESSGQFIIFATDGQQVCHVFEPEIQCHKGDKKPDLDPAIIESLHQNVANLTRLVQRMIDQLAIELKQFEQESQFPFTTDTVNQIAKTCMDYQEFSLLKIKDDCAYLDIQIDK